MFVCQAVRGGICSGWMLTGQPLEVTADWSEQTLITAPDPDQWTCLGSRHDRTDYYGEIPLATVLKDVNVNILFVLHPLDIAPMGPLAGDPHRLRPERTTLCGGRDCRRATCCWTEYRSISGDRRPRPGAAPPRRSPVALPGLNRRLEVTPGVAFDH